MKSQIIITILSAALAVLGAVLVYQLTKKEPTLVLIVADPDIVFGEDKVRQMIAARNQGNNLAKSVQITVQTIKLRLEEHVISGQPPVECKKSFDDLGTLVFNCGHLKPNASIIIRLVHKRPPLLHKEVNIYSENVSGKKITQSIIVTIQQFREGR